MGTLVRAGMTPAERCRYVADLIEAHPENFDMEWWVDTGRRGVTLSGRKCRVWALPGGES